MSIIKTAHPVSLVHNSNRMFLNSFTFYISPANGSPFTVNSPNHIKPWPAAISQYQVHVWWWLLHIFVEQTCDYMIYNLTWERYKPVHVRICVCECVCVSVCVWLSELSHCVFALLATSEEYLFHLDIYWNVLQDWYTLPVIFPSLHVWLSIKFMYFICFCLSISSLFVIFLLL